MPVLLAFIFTGVIFLDQNENQTNIFDYTFLLPWLLTLNVVAMLSGFFVSKALKLKYISQFTIAIEVGLQNSALAIFVSSSLLNSPEMSIIAVIYGGFSFFSTIGMAWLMRLSIGKETLSEEKALLEQ